MENFVLHISILTMNKNNTVNSVCVDDMVAELSIIARSELGL